MYVNNLKTVTDAEKTYKINKTVLKLSNYHEPSLKSKGRGVDDRTGVHYYSWASNAYYMHRICILGSDEFF